MSPPLTLQVAGRTDVGSVRQNNEDNFGYDTRCGIFLVCDGMGGHVGGERASKIAVETILGYFRQDPGNRHQGLVGRSFEGVSERASALAGALQLANQAIQEQASQNPTLAGMGSTIVAVLVEGGLFSVAHVGDSRVYLLRDRALQQLTTDHSLVMEQVRRGLMTPEEAEKSEMQNVIVRSLGVEESVEPDLADHELAAEDILLLCCDGLSRFVPESKMIEVITQAETLDKACADLIEAAKTLGSDDNITCVLVRATTLSRRERTLDALIPGRGRLRWQSAG